tara:strand:+ start:973 stop:1395 length:423 start_codon:yes stop_codon:yes gene_type:complete
MRLKNIYGKLVYKNVRSKLIDWDGKSRSKVQRQVKKFLKDYWSKCIVYEEFPVYGSRMSVDILNATKKIAVEVQGRQHDEYNKFFHKNKINYLYSMERDFNKKKWLEQNDFQLVEILELEAANLNEKFFSEKYGIILQKV